MATLLPNSAQNSAGTTLNGINSAQNISQPTFNVGGTTPQTSALSGLGNALGVNNSVQYNDNLALMNHANAFNQFMSDTAYQRTVADMEKAGINPVVAFGLGKGQLDSSLSSAQATTSSTAGTTGKLASGVLGGLLKFLGDLF